MVSLDRLRVATVGGGNIGRTLGARWTAAGHYVTYGLRDPAKLPGATDIATAIASADFVLLAVPGVVAVEVVERHASDLADKVLLDASNNFKAETYNSFAAWAHLLRETECFRVFNTSPWEVFRDGGLEGQRGDAFYCGPDTGSRTFVERLVTDVGLRPLWVGGPEKVEVVDGVLRLYVAMAKQKGRLVAFRMLSEQGEASRL